MNHGELAADLVRRDRHVLPDVFGVADDVEVGARGLDHDDIGAFLDIPVDGSAGETPTAWGELIAFAVTKGRARAGCVAERTVQAAGEFRRVGHQDYFVGNACFDQFQLDGSDAAVVHVGGRYAMSAGIGIRNGNVADAVNGELIVEGAIVPKDTAVAVGGIFAKTDIGNDEEGGEPGSQEPDCLNDRALGVISCGPKGVLGSVGDGYAEEDHRAEPFVDERSEVGN